jgi:hypothetical protein
MASILDRYTDAALRWLEREHHDKLTADQRLMVQKVMFDMAWQAKMQMDADRMIHEYASPKVRPVIS